MARRRRRPLSPIAWLLGVIISVSGVYTVYQARTAAIENMAQRQIEHSRATTQKLQQQQQARQQQLAPQVPLSPEQLVHQQALQTAERRRQAELATAARLKQAELAKKEEAWERFYSMPSSCRYPESDKRVDACKAAESRAWQQFEAAWTSGQLQSQR